MLYVFLFAKKIDKKKICFYLSVSKCIPCRRMDFIPFVFPSISNTDKYFANSFRSFYLVNFSSYILNPLWWNTPKKFSQEKRSTMAKKTFSFCSFATDGSFAWAHGANIYISLVFREFFLTDSCWQTECNKNVRYIFSKTKKLNEYVKNYVLLIVWNFEKEQEEKTIYAAISGCSEKKYFSMSRNKFPLNLAFMKLRVNFLDF